MLVNIRLPTEKSNRLEIFLETAHQFDIGISN